MLPFVSVIIPTYNRAVSIGRAIESVLGQTYVEYEIVVVDDGSTDNTQQILKTYDGLIKCIAQKNAGVSAARNAGIQIARGEWIAFLDSDDQWFPNYLKLQIECIERSPEIIAQVSNAVTIYRDGRKEDHFLGTKLLPLFLDKESVVLRRPLYIGGETRSVVCAIIGHATVGIDRMRSLRPEVSALLRTLIYLRGWL